MALRLTPERIVALAASHRREGFDCGVDALNRYLKHQARQDAQRHVAAPFVLLGQDDAVLGFYTLSASLIGVDELPETLQKRLPRYPHLPVSLLGRLAVDKSAAGQGAGALLLTDALRRCLEGASRIGAMAVTVDAKDAPAERFYRHFDFLPLQSNPTRLFLPMTQIACLFGAGT
jgi:GNAT superfamily N-acetyltransferase